MNLIKLSENQFVVEQRDNCYYGTLKQVFVKLRKELVPASEVLIGLEEMLKKNHNLIHFGEFGHRGYLYTQDVDVLLYLPHKGAA